MRDRGWEMGDGGGFSMGKTQAFTCRVIPNRNDSR